MKKIIFVGLLILVFAFAVFGCGAKQEPADNGGEQQSQTGEQQQSKEPVKIGFFAPLTGPAAADGESVQNAAELAVEQINDAGGINGQLVELVDYDDGLDSKQAVNIAQKLTTKDNVVATVSGSYSGPTRAVAPIFQRAKIPMISAYALHPEITKAGDFIFRQSFVGTVQGKAGAYVAVEMLGAKKIAILHIDNDFGSTLAQSFEAYAEAKGAEVVSIDSFSFGEKEFTPVLTKIKEEGADLVYMPAYAGEGAQIVRQAKDLGLEAQLLGTEGVDSTTQFLEVAADTADGLVITTNLNRDSDREVVQKFLTDYSDFSGHAPDMVAASTYDAFMVLASVMKEYGTEPAQILEGLSKVKNFEAVTGVLHGYNELGEVTKAVQVQEVKNGKFHSYGQIDDPEIITPPNK